MRAIIFVCVLNLGCSLRAAAAEFPTFHPQEIDPLAGKICYAVTVADVNGDDKPDVVAVTEDAVVWYANPSWRKQDIIRGATARITYAFSRMTSMATAASISPWRRLASTRHQEPQHASMARPRFARPLADPSHQVRRARIAPASLG